jgi:hypothetical protein
MPKPRPYRIKAKLWLYPGESAKWHFITIPKKESADLKKMYASYTKGWGSLPVVAQIGKTIWETSIFPDSKTHTYLLPIKALVRRKEGLEAGDSCTCVLNIRI